MGFKISIRKNSIRIPEITKDKFSSVIVVIDKELERK